LGTSERAKRITTPITYELFISGKIERKRRNGIYCPNNGKNEQKNYTKLKLGTKSVRNAIMIDK
jgi:hypothetical protein